VSFIKQALDSFLAQKINCDFEIIISDDFSQDGTRDILYSYWKKYPDIIRPILGKSNIGMIANFIRALSACTGDYIAYCDGDDYWIGTDKSVRREYSV
jgi:glycosyltransferase involved in cell wall biosynthesis